MAMTDSLMQKQVVVDTDSHLAYVGRLSALDDHYLQLEAVAIYDRHEARVPLEKFLIECASFDPAISRRSLTVRQSRVIALSLLSDVIVP